MNDSNELLPVGPSTVNAMPPVLRQAVLYTAITLFIAGFLLGSLVMAALVQVGVIPIG